LVKSPDKYPDIAYLAGRVAVAYAVCLVAHFIMQPGGLGELLWYFVLTAGLGIPVALAATDVPRGFAASAIAVRGAAALAAAIAFIVVVVDLRDFITWNAIYLYPLVAAAISDRVWRDRRKAD
jgi:hypothetical protein